MTSHRPVLRLFLALLLVSLPLRAEQVQFRRAVDLALQHSGVMAMAAADQARAYQGYMEAKNTFIPNLVLGSGLGYSYGYPMSIEGSAPTVFNVNTQSFLINPAQRAFMKAARIDWMAASTSKEDKRAQVILDTALTWSELDKVLSQIKLVQQQQDAATHQQDIASQRVQAGVDNQMELTKAQLAVARVRMRVAELSSTANVLREHLAQLTGLPAAGLETETESLPALPAPPDDPNLAQRVAAESPIVRSAEQQADAKAERARGEHKQLYPALDFAGSYGLFAKFNNYQDFFKKFQHNNFTIGAGIRLPIFNFAQKAHAAAADADALAARKQAQAVKEQVSTDTMKLQGAVRQLAAARDVAKLEYDLAKAGTQATDIKVQSGQGNIRDQQTARIDEIGRYEAYLDANFEYLKAQLTLMKQSGDLAAWAGVGKP
jgi:outer membrane protein TolC